VHRNKAGPTLDVFVFQIPYSSFCVKSTFVFRYLLAAEDTIRILLKKVTKLLESFKKIERYVVHTLCFTLSKALITTPRPISGGFFHRNNLRQPIENNTPPREFQIKTNETVFNSN
jgi:hypothetical protein